MGAQYRQNSLARSLPHLVRQALIHPLYPRPRVVGARLLIDGLRRGLHKPPHNGITGIPAAPSKLANQSPTSKITAYDRQVNVGDYSKSPSSLALQQHNVGGPLWLVAKSVWSDKCKRITIEHLEEVRAVDIARRPEVGTYGKWKFRKLLRVLQRETPKPKEDSQSHIHYWTRSRDDAIYLSPHSPPCDQEMTLTRITLLMQRDDPGPRPAMQVARDYSTPAELPPLMWERYPDLWHKVDYESHVADELRRQSYYINHLVNETFNIILSLRKGKPKKKWKKQVMPKKRKMPPRVPSWIEDGIKWFDHSHNTLQLIIDHWNPSLRKLPLASYQSLANPRAPPPE